MNRPMRPGEAVRRCRCGHVVVARAGDRCPKCPLRLGGDVAPAEGLPPGFVLVGAWPREGAA